MDLNKKGFFFMLIFVSTGFIVGGCYSLFCKDKIAMRENHLISLSYQITPPEGAIKIEECLFDKMIYRTYLMYYHYQQKASNGIAYYEKELLTQGYKIERKGGNYLEAEKDGILVKINIRNKEIEVQILFDDIFPLRSI